MSRADKEAAVAELANEFRNSNGAVLTDYRGLSVDDLQALRRALGENATYAIVKNTLTKLAAEDAGIDGIAELLVGPSAIAFVKGDVVETAKGLRDFGRTNEALIIKGGHLEGNPVTADEIRQLADLESRDVLLSKLAGALQASLQNAVSLFNAPLADAARVFGALQTKLEQDSPAEAETPSETDPEAEAPAEPETAADGDS
ncbi:MAG: 50S ribosomal protein L10 [Nocardioidaceae bacterium]